MALSAMRRRGRVCKTASRTAGASRCGGLMQSMGVLQEHDGVAHIDIIDAVCGLCKAELAQGTLQLRLVFPTAAERIGVPLLKTSGKQLVEEHRSASSPSACAASTNRIWPEACWRT